ncbi:extracellular solute-binding protein [Weissella koreensis KACC 15510]|uniref:transporter substrate-binding domain-containing protein n=1 Tax=Weissella koreensis TaxID=165096 RepID=UPI0002174E78|nr:transporter substrate-binding domain-containing protein [Weissella koreensis]AEJ23305.1 extracellular solute-binding protein [Weissella koreensis KACC 15510]
MKNFIKIGSALAIALGLSLGFGSSVSADQQKNQVLDRIEHKNRMVWGTKADTSLMGLMNIKTGKVEGFDVDVAKEVTRRINPQAKTEFVQVTSGTRIPLLINNNIDAIIATMSITPERAKTVDFSKPYFNAGQSLMVKKGSDIKNISDVNNRKVTVLGVQGSTSVEEVKEKAPKARVLALSDYATALSALKAGQGDVLTTDSGILAGMAKDDTSLKLVGGNFTNEPYGIAIEKNNPKLVKKVNQAIDAMQKDGTYARLMKKWFSDVPGMDWKEMAKL